MTVRCLCFASLQSITGSPELSLELPEGARVDDLLNLLEGRYPAFLAYSRRYRVAVDQELAEPGQALHEGAEVALLPAVSGGGVHDLVKLTETEISVDECLAFVRSPDCGAVVLFLGTVRDHALGQPVERLEYTAYEAMARKELDTLAAEVHTRFPIGRLALWHRYGTLVPGEISVCVAVSSPHRAEAFEAGRWAIDTLKSSVPLWKKEVGPDGAVWIEGDARTPA